jgi:putative transposase
MVGVQARREQALYAVKRGLNQRRACTLLSISRSSLTYISRMPFKDEVVIRAMQKLSGQYPRFGYRRIKILLSREGLSMRMERCARIWSQAGLQVPKRKRRRISRDSTHPMKASYPNAVWSYDFVHDACANGQKLKCLTVIDEYTRECLAIEVAGAIRSHQVIEVLTRLMSVHGMPSCLRSDNGPEFVSTALLKWVNDDSLGLLLIEPGKPWQNGTNESFNGKFRDECLSAEWFRNRLEAKVVIEDWRNHYNQVRPHSSLGYKTPMEFKFELSFNLTNGAKLSSSNWY